MIEPEVVLDDAGARMFRQVLDPASVLGKPVSHRRRVLEEPAVKDTADSLALLLVAVLTVGVCIGCALHALAR